MAVVREVVCCQDEIQINHHNQIESELAKYLIITSEGQFKWKKKQVVIWSMPCGGCKQYENIAIDIRLYRR